MLRMCVRVCLQGILNHSLRASRYASSSAVATSSSSSSWLSGGYSSSLPSMNIPLAGVSLPPPLSDHVEPSKLKTTTLPNGLTIATEMSPVRASFSNPPVKTIGIAK